LQKEFVAYNYRLVIIDCTRLYNVIFILIVVLHRIVENYIRGAESIYRPI